jgi:hypothetical protein
VPSQCRQWFLRVPERVGPFVPWHLVVEGLTVAAVAADAVGVVERFASAIEFELASASVGSAVVDFARIVVWLPRSASVARALALPAVPLRATLLRSTLWHLLPPVVAVHVVVVRVWLLVRVAVAVWAPPRVVVAV